MSENYIIAKYVNHITKQAGVTVRDIETDPHSKIIVKNDVLILSNHKQQDNRIWTIDYMGLERKSAKDIKFRLLAIYHNLGYETVSFLQQSEA